MGRVRQNVSDTPPLLGPGEIRALAAELGIRPTKTLGQNFVIDPNTIRRIIGAARIDPNQTILEVGPGLGSLTLGLLDAGARVIAVEIDPALAAQLPRTIAQYRPHKTQNLHVINRDALKVTELPAPPQALVANLPYNVAVPVLLYLFARFPTLKTGLVMVQDEVADRLAAGPGTKTYGVPSLKASWYARVAKAGVIGKNVFWPAPKINSGLVRFTMRDKPPSTVARNEVFTVIDAAFAQRRKTLRAALASWAGGGEYAEKILHQAGIDPTVRGEKLDIYAYIRIAEAAHHLRNQPQERK